MGIGENGRVDLSEVIRNRLYFAPLHWTEDSVVLSALPRAGTAFCIDNELVYEPFWADFGPLNIACTYRFCWKLHSLLKDAEELGRCVLFYCGADQKRKSNAAVLLGTYLVLFAGVEPDVAYGPLSMFEPYAHFRDPTCGASTYHLTVLDCIRAVTKAAKVGWIDFNKFKLDEYEYFDQVENGDLNWIVPNKLLAFSGPSARRIEIYGYRTLIPEDYVEYFNRVGVTAVIRLNKRTYDRRRFADHGIAHHDLYFPDGSCPTERILKRFLEIVEETPGALAVHCKAGLGRTGVLIGCYIMKHYRFTCTEVLGYLRMVRPGSVIGPQQHYLRDMQRRLWRAGDIMRQQQAQSNANSREYMPTSSHDGAPPPSLLSDQPAKTSASAATAHTSAAGAQSWTSSKNRFSNSRTYSTNPVVKRDNPKETAASRNGLAKVTQRSSHPSWTEQHVPPLLQRLKKISASHASLSCLPSTGKDDRGYHNDILVCGNVSCSNDAIVSSSAESKDDGGNSGNKTQKIRIPTPARPSSLLRSAQSGLFKGGCLEGSMRSVSLNADKEPSCSSPSSKSIRGSPYNSRSLSMPKQHIGPSSDGLGILRNVGGIAPSSQATGSVVVQRIVNSAGQPRKVVLPVVEEMPGSSHQQERKKREGSPSRRYSSPGRVSGSQGSHGS
ncbi:hypothetical protein R1flu_028806 [Riccia fluitans]|uniref:protein-tyrosine-phosphatase n=1 Tax=Riccia fluitans TaxID=41844 RepID=A0ABD1XND8_9MARC